MAIVLAVQRWRPYLLGRKFVVRTDQSSLNYLLDQRLVSSDHQRWLTKLLGYDFEIHYRPGSGNKAADALSRVNPGATLSLLLVPHSIDVTELQQKVDQDARLQQIKKAIEVQPSAYPSFSLDQGHLLYQGRLVISSSSSFIPTLFQLYHDSPLGGHSGEFKTYKRLVAEWYWLGMKRDVQQYVRSCQVCQ